MMEAVSPDNDDLHLDLRFTDRPNKLIQPLAIAGAAIGIILILATMTTSLAEKLLPMSDEYLQVLVPRASDGKEPLALKTLDHVITDNNLVVTGSFANRTDFPLTGLIVRLLAYAVNGASQTVDVPVEPSEVPPGGTATFQITLTLPDKPGRYSLEFRVPDGPVVPHMDDRAATYLGK
jgi:hypothetical protein